MDPGQVDGVDEAELDGDDRAPVSALRAVAVVAEMGHELRERIRDPPGVPTRLVGRPGKRVAGNRRAHDVERVGGVPAVRTRIRQGADDLDELDDRTGPA